MHESNMKPVLHTTVLLNISAHRFSQSRPSGLSLPYLYDVQCCSESAVLLYRERLCSITSLPCGDLGRWSSVAELYLL